MNQSKRLLSIVLILFLSPLILFGISQDSLRGIRNNKLEAYKFIRSSYNPDDMTLLIGNAEMGGRARLDGLGFDRLWFSDFWRASAVRMPIYGPSIQIGNGIDSIKKYEQELQISDGILTTSVETDKASYKSEIFFSMARPDLMVIELSEIEGISNGQLELQLPVHDMDIQKTGFHKNVGPTEEFVFTTKRLSKNIILGQSIDEKMDDAEGTRRLAYPFAVVRPHIMNKMVWGVYSNCELGEIDAEGKCSINIDGNEKVLLLFANATNWDGASQEELVLNALRSSHNMKLLRSAHQDVWRKTWEKGAVIDIPDKRHEKLWYRSNYWLHVTCGSDKFLPGESQFSAACWSMLTFTLGSGWGTHAFLATGYPEKAQKMLDWHYQPDAMRYNAHHWLKLSENFRRKLNLDSGKDFSEGELYKPDTVAEFAKAFAHEAQIFGKDRLFWICNQPHLQQYGLTMFNKAQQLYPSIERLANQTYPVAKGIAEYWSNFLVWDNKRQMYITPPVFSMAEGGNRESPLDAMISAKWCLKTAVDCAKQLNVDANLIEKWQTINNLVKLPQTDEVYIDHLQDDGEIRKETGYAGTKRVILSAGFTSQEIIPDFDRQKVLKTLDRSSESNGFGQGMAIFQAEWIGICEALYNRGDQAYKYMEQVFNCLDPISKTAMCETFEGKYPYFLTNSNTYILCPLYLMMHSYNDQISVFPALPSSWKDVAFYNLPAEHGIRVSGEMKNGIVNWVTFEKDGEELLKKSDTVPVRIVEEFGKISLQSSK